ncbi:MAG: hypothetical protein NVV60_08175 [Luteimonas sp.]|nr:hypothetical protein [Luteimonas sp.]
MRAIHCILMAALLALPAMALAQQAPPIQQAMSPEEFKASGLDKLSTEELARLNAWLDRRVEQETTAAVAAASEQAREEGRKEVVEKNRGFFHFGSDEPIVASIVGEFAGFGRGQRYRLDNGQVWEQTDTARLNGVRRSNPQVRIRPGALGGWWLKLDGFNTQAKVQRVE